MNKIFQSKVTFGIIGFLLGATSLYFVQTFWRDKPLLTVAQNSRWDAPNLDPLLDEYFDKSFFGRNHDPFEEMRKIRKRMLKNLSQNKNSEPFPNFWDSWYRNKFGGGEVGDITQREDAHSVYYDIAVKGLKDEKVDVQVQDGQITISGKVENRSNENGSLTFSSSSFHRSFPVPENVDPAKVQMSQEKNKIVLAFPKVDSHG